MAFEPPLVPDALLPVQISQVVDASAQPEKRLMLAVLEEAVATFQRTVREQGRRARRLHGEAADWFASADVSWPYAFRNVCDALGLESEWLHEGLLRWQATLPPDVDGRPRTPFRRVSGSRTRATGRPIGLRRTA
jgi:hypothetical protein